MIRITFIALAAGSALLTGSAERWTANLSPKDGSMLSGTATVETVGNDSSRVSITVKGAPASAALPWHIHTGPCSAVGGVLGSDTAYPKLQVSASGDAEASATVAAGLTKSASYAVQVHRDATAPTMNDDPRESKPGSDVLACGDLKVANPTIPER
jgi:hypothetical protein